MPDGALGPAQAPDEEAVDLDLLAGPGGVDVPLDRRDLGASFVGIAVPGDQRQALVAGVQPDPAQDAPDAVLADPDAAPLLPGQLRADAPRAVAGVPEGEGDDPLLEVRADLVGHPRAATLPDVQRLKAPAIHA